MLDRRDWDCSMHPLHHLAPSLHAVLCNAHLRSFSPAFHPGIIMNLHLGSSFTKSTTHTRSPSPSFTHKNQLQNASNNYKKETPSLASLAARPLLQQPTRSPITACIPAPHSMKGQVAICLYYITFVST
jgi:hypothetical protein